MKKLLCLAMLFFLNSSTYAGIDVERATRETDQLLRRREKIEEELKPIPAQAPEELKVAPVPVKPEEQTFFIKKIDLSGCESFSPEDFAPLIQKYENKEVTLTDLQDLAKEIERDYLQKGVIAAVFLPPQDIKDQTVILQVVEAKMGQLQIQEHRYFREGMLDFYWTIRRGAILRYDRIAKAVQIMNKNPDREVRAALKAGKKPGTTDVVLTAKTRIPVHFTSTFDNEGVSTTGRSRLGLGIRDNNFLGIDDTFLSGYTFGQAFDGIYFYHNLPVSPQGLSFLYGYSRSQSTPKKDYQVYGLKSEAKNISWSLSQDIYEKDQYRGTVSLGFNANDKVTKMNTGVSNRDRLRSISLSGNFLQRDFGSTTNYSLEVSQGLAAFGASSKDNPLASRGAKSVYTKLNLGAQQRRILPLNLQGNFKFQSQIAATKLTPQEEFRLGGINSVRGYPPGDYLADQAALTNLELLIPAFFLPQSWRIPYDKDPLKKETTFLVFADYGWGMRLGALPTEKKSVNFLGLGAGLRFRFFDQALVRLEWGFPVANNSITETGDSRFHFSVDFQDKIPEEIARIQKLLEEENIQRLAWQLVNAELARPDSPIRERLENYLRLGKEAYERQELSQAKEFYEKLTQSSKSLYQQSEDYVRACFAQQKELKEYQKQAWEYYKLGKLNQAKSLWQKIADNAKSKTLILEF